MRNVLKMFGLSMAGVGALVIGGAVDAADNSRAGYNISRLNRNAGATARMPFNSTVGSFATFGNFTTNTSGGGISGTGVKPGSEGPDDDSDPVTTYTVDDCMNDILRCVNSGALPGGLNDLFDADARNMIFSQGGICVTQIENCMANLGGLYKSPIDVWYDFNQRKIQPEYYNFVLRQTGLTPFQAEETCKRLDKKLYGTSFSAEGKGGNLSYEYNRGVNAYNANAEGKYDEFDKRMASQNNNASGKKSDVDEQRGYYARWDATQGQCMIRVAAYNNEKLVTNSWLFGAIGDNTPAEVWKKAGDSFKCNKDLFGFALLNQTKTVALVGVGGGTLLGAGIGAATGKKKHSFDCSKNADFKQLEASITGVDKATLAKYGVKIEQKFTTANCNDLVSLKNKYEAISDAVLDCGTNGGADIITVDSIINIPDDANDDWYLKQIPVCYKADAKTKESCGAVLNKLCRDDSVKTVEACRQKLDQYTKQDVVDTKDNPVTGSDGSVYKLLTIVGIDIKKGEELCKFKPLRTAKTNLDIYCKPDQVTDENTCFTAAGIKKQLEELKLVMDRLQMKGQDEDTRGKNAGIGAAVGAAAGGVATAITAFVEHSNISCHVGDNLATVGMGKSYNIETLREFYVKWGLNLTDLQPTEDVFTKAQWGAACSKYDNDLDSCMMLKVKVNTLGDATLSRAPSAADTKPPVSATYDPVQTVSSACRVQGGRCVANATVLANFFE